MVQNDLKIKCALKIYRTPSCFNLCFFPNNYKTKAKNMNNLLRKTSLATSIAKSIQEV